MKNAVTSVPYLYVTQIPKCTRKKYEIATMESANPIKQDIKEGKLREFRKVCDN